MARSKLTSSRSTPRPSTRSQQHSPPRSKPSVVINVKNPSTAASSSREETSDNDDDSVCSSKSSDVPPRSSVTKGKAKDDLGGAKAPWRHPDELDYFRPHDWSEDRIISQLRSLVYSVAPPVVGKQPFIEITLYVDGNFDKPKVVKVPRGYRVPLMFAAKFQWASLKLVLTSAQRDEEWSYYKFDILHLSRLCERFFTEAQIACSKGIIDVPPAKARAPEFQFDPGAMTRKWRCATFDRALARYNKNWLICREEFLRDFYREFEDEEYAKDVLKIDWSRWALKGHKGFKLTQDELRSGIDGRMITRGLKKDNGGKWVWVDPYVIKQEEVAVAVEPIHQTPTTTEISGKPFVPGNEDVPAASREFPAHPQIVSADSQTVQASTNGQTSHESSIQPSPQALKLTEEAAEGSPVPVRPLSPEDSANISEVQLSHQNPGELPPAELAPKDKSYTTLSSVPESASFGIPPAITSEPLKDPTSTSSRSSSVLPASVQDPDSNPSHSPTAPIAPPTLTQVTPPSRPSLSPQPPASSSAISNAISQSPRSPKPASPTTSTPAPGGIEAVPETPSLNMPNPNIIMSDHSQDSIFENGREESKATITIDQSFSPTSIDSTPTPSPTITPTNLNEMQHPQAATFNTISSGPSVATTFVSRSRNATPDFESQQSLNIPTPPTMSYNDFVMPQESDFVTALSAILGLPKPPRYPHQPILPANQNGSALERARLDNDTKPAIGPRSPVFLSPLLPPVTKSRSGSPDEIPGLGGLSSRSPFTFLSQPALHPRNTVPDTKEQELPPSPSRSLTRSSSPMSVETPDRPIRSNNDGPDQPAFTAVENTPTPSKTNGAILPATYRNSARSETDDWYPSSPRLKSGRDLVCKSISAAQQPSMTPPPIIQSQSQSQSDEDDEDSDMDFGTPVTSPVIIMPGLRRAEIDFLPAPLSPSPLPKPILGDGHLEATTPLSEAEASTPGLAVSRASTPKVETMRAPAVTPRAVTLPPAERADSGSPMDIQSPAKERERGGDGKGGQVTQTHTGVFSTLVSVAATPSSGVFVPNRGSSAQFPASPVTGPTSSAPDSTLPTPAQILALSVSPLHSSIPLPPVPTASLQTQAPVSPVITASFSAPIPPLSPRLQSTALREQVLHAEPSRTNQPLSQAAVRQAPLQSTSCREQEATATTPHRPPLQLDPYRDQAFPVRLPASQSSPYPTSHSSSPSDDVEPALGGVRHASRKRQRDEDSDEEHTANKSRKGREGLSIREGGTVVRKVVSMVRDTLTGLNDLLEIAAESEIIPSGRMRSKGIGKGKEKVAEAPYRKGSPVRSHTLPLPHTSPTPQRQTSVELNEVAWLHGELQAMKAEMVQLKEQKTRETPAEPDVRTMRMEIEALREQIRVLKEAKTTASEASEVRDMRDEITFLKNEMRSLQSISRRSSFGPSTPSTPNLSFKLNNHTMAQMVHPLAHLLAAEPDTTPPTPVSAGTAADAHKQYARQREHETPQMAQSDASQSRQPEASEKQRNTSPHGSAIFDDIPLPVKSKRKARVIFSRS